MEDIQTPAYSANLEKFLSLVTPWLDGLHWIDLSYVALRNLPGDVPVILSAKANLSSILEKSTIKNYSVTFSTDHIVAGRAFLPLRESYQKFFSDLEEGRVSVHGMDLALETDNGRHTFAYFPYYPPHISDGPRFPTYIVSGVTKWDLHQTVGVSQESLTWELKSADTPYENFDELQVSLGLTASSQRDACSIMITANAPAIVKDDSLIESNTNTARIHCLADKGLALTDIKLGYRILRRQLIERGAVCGGSLRWKEDGNLRVGQLQLPAGDAHAIQMFLSYKGEALHQWWVIDPNKFLNSHYAAHQSIDAGLSVLKSFVLGESNNPGTDFEAGLASLLGILGFSVSLFGKQTRQRQDAADLIASTPQGNIAIIECTTRHLNNNGKISKLISRRNALRDQLDKNDLSHVKLQPVIVTSLARTDVEPDLGEARKYKISVLCREELTSLINTEILLPPTPDQLFNNLGNFVPVS